MGAWGAGPFDNDNAMDFVLEIESLDDIKRVLVASNEEGHVLISPEVDSDLSCRIIVAGECIAAMRGHPSPDLPDELAKRLHGFGAAPLDLLALVRANISAVMSRSELLELWAEAEPEDRAAFNLAMTDLVERLCLPPRKPRRPSRKKKTQLATFPCSFCDKPTSAEEAHRFELRLSDDKFQGRLHGGWVHLSCVNAVLHPKHLIQNWEMDDEFRDYVFKKMNERG